MVKKVLLVATVDYHFKAFHLPVMKWFKEQGWEVHIAACGNLTLPYTDLKFNIPIQRSPFRSQNWLAYKELKDIIREHDYDMIHSHTPMGGVIARLAALNARKRGTKAIYTAHGFHFCKGGPLSSWILYYPIEMALAAVTDCLITINKEDYDLAVQHPFNSSRIEQINGVGVDTEQFKPMDAVLREKKRKLLGYAQENFLMFYAAEFNENKNQELLIRALSSIKDKVPNAKLLLAGEGKLLESCKQLAKELKTDHLIEFLGFRKDIADLLPLCDAAVGSSYREGLPVNIMEAMACGLPVIATENRGHKELVVSGENGWLVKAGDAEDMAGRMLQLINYPVHQLHLLGEASKGKIEKQYSEKIVLQQSRALYAKYMKDTGGAAWAVQ
ncbi:glycosyltransferase family 4 protein [Metabacillus sp. KIGAM252]|uniref:Glycosyltransferase family 4 protein n=1 Tax=Metabacillus flavus TaxID=2823519 RepID=A0ABS5LFX4_9BACI|nr:glycosyltransferase family 4 protein [Metabacillus flavus]MBS2969662.1 glycosyltransferase family 4 protein [Metabacillus flavus]